MTTFGPSWARYRLYLLAIAPLAALLLVIDFVRNRQSLPEFAAILTALVLVLVVYFALFFRNYRITAEPHLLEVRNWRGAKRTLGPDLLDRVVVVEAYQDNGVTVPYLMVLDRDGKRVLALNGRVWSREQMTQLASTLAIPVDSLDLVRARELRRRYPRAVSIVVARPYLSGFVLAVVVVALLVIGVVIYTAATYPE